MPKKKLYGSTYERLIDEDPDFKETLDKSYREFVFSEFLLAVMAEDHISVRKLAQEAGVSPSLIQDLRTHKKDNLTFRSFTSIVDALGYDIVLEKRRTQRESLNKLKISPRQPKLDRDKPPSRKRTERTL